MFKRKASSLALSLALACAALAPQAALGGRLSDASVKADAAAGDSAPAVKEDAAGEAPAAQAEAQDGAQDGAHDGARPQPKRKGNAFARALSAPFRALARLFGGGGKSKSETAKKSTPPAPRTAQKVEVDKSAAPEAPERGEGDASATTTVQTAAPPTSQTAAEAAQPGPVQVPTVAPILKPADAARTREAAEAPGAVAPPAARPAEGARILRPSDGEVARELQPKMWIPKIVGVPSDPISQGRALLEHGYIQEAIAELQIAVTTALPERLAEANNLLGVAYDRLGWHLQAANAYRRALAASPKDHVALANLGYSLYLADDYAGALKRLRQAARLAPSEPVILNNLGVVNARLGRFDEAYKNFARASGEYEAHLKLAGILEDRRRDGEAVKHYEAALRLQPDASAVLERLAALYERTGARDKADTARRALGRPQPNPQKTATGGGG
ncbi:MAG TPA: hypothetical protein VF668_18165 [Pyrinomonadaceae bacterium]